MNDFQQITYDRGFRTLFEDSVYLLMASERELDKNHDTSSCMARGSIACTMMLPEVSANICIESLNLERSVFNEIDKLAPLAKFDFFLRTTFRKRKINNGELPVQKVQELKKLRDVYVHPKKQTVVWTEISDSAIQGESERTQFLDMSKNPSMWYFDDAKHAMRGAHEFLRHFFRETCRFSKTSVTTLLFSTDPNLSCSKGCDHYYHQKSFREALRRWKVDTTYFRIYTH